MHEQVRGPESDFMFLAGAPRMDCISQAPWGRLHEGSGEEVLGEHQEFRF